MHELPKGSRFFPEGRQDITLPYERPRAMPYIPAGKVLICKYIVSHDAPSLTRYFVCESVKDMQELYDGYAEGYAADMEWFLCDSESIVLTSRDIKGSSE